QIAHLESSAVMHPVGGEPTIRAAHHSTSVDHLDHQLLEKVYQHRDHADATQVQTNRHTIRLHQGPSLLGDMNITEYRGALTLNLAFSPDSGSPLHRAVSEMIGQTLVESSKSDGGPDASGADDGEVPHPLSMSVSGGLLTVG